jgi:hypothetical protein
MIEQVAIIIFFCDFKIISNITYIIAMTTNHYGGYDCKNDVWNKARTIPGKDLKLYRKDPYGSVIYKQSYGKDSPMGWNIDHKIPKSKGGSDSFPKTNVVMILIFLF